MLEPESLKSPLMKLRQRLDWTQQQLADAIGVSKQTISYWETGRVEPRLTIRQVKALDKLLRMVGQTVQDLPDDVGPRKPKLHQKNTQNDDKHSNGSASNDLDRQT